MHCLNRARVRQTCRVLVALCWVPFFCTGCATLYQIQISDIYGAAGAVSPVEVKVSETGIDVQQAANLAAIFVPSRQVRSEVRSVGAIVGLFQYGPKTGNPVYSEIYADQVVRELVRSCPSGRITGVVSVRERRSYPVVSGEVVKIGGLCVAAPSEGHAP